ncbi:MAG: hypothetical protein ACLTNH_10565 [Enterocloster sp.]
MQMAGMNFQTRSNN